MNPTPISSIPVEILSIIFEEFCASSLSNSDCARPELTLTHVCQHWRELATNLPDLWSNILASADTPSHITTLYIARSQERCLDLDLDLRHDASDHLRRESALGLWSLIKTTTSRWRKLNIQIGPHDATAFSEDLREVGAPRLETLQVSSASHIAGLTKIFEGGSPCLKSLRLVGLSLLRFTPSTDSLTHLDLMSNCPMQFATFAKIMNRMVCLEDLTIRSRVVEGWPTHPTQEDIIHLPSLAVLKISDRRWPLFIPLLSIVAPKLHTLSLYDLVAHDLPDTASEHQLRSNLPEVTNCILRGGSTYIDEDDFGQLSRMFPKVSHFGMIDVDEFFVKQSSTYMHKVSIWPRLQTISMMPAVGEELLCSLITARTVPTTETQLQTVMLPIPTQLKRIDWMSQKVNIKKCDDSDALRLSTIAAELTFAVQPQRQT
ncbi:hypothetical protein CVT24_001521 [Panaeolus cyanescens]|uniref:F-box domain-containing protein n=1 Tax=Panaeolus cyanescens TaxID=181874 RepID=A0A409YF96_9AGAR|nr:hypothetical protein CVT24_001521 [Panaeolus cyanescens]